MNTIESNFVPYQIALDMKSIGFDERCFGYYDNVFKIHLCSFETMSDRGFISAPLYQQAFRWFREKYNLVHTVYSNASGYIWELHYNQERGGTHICDSGESGDCEMSGMFTTYEKAELECLKKLIEIVKQKK